MNETICLCDTIHECMHCIASSYATGQDTAYVQTISAEPIAHPFSYFPVPICRCSLRIGVVPCRSFGYRQCQTQSLGYSVHFVYSSWFHATHVLLTFRCTWVSFWEWKHVVIDFCDDTGFQSISCYLSLCMLHLPYFISDLYYVAITRFVGLRLFILFSGLYFCIYYCRGCFP